MRSARFYLYVVCALIALFHAVHPVPLLAEDSSKAGGGVKRSPSASVGDSVASISSELPNDNFIGPLLLKSEIQSAENHLGENNSSLPQDKKQGGDDDGILEQKFYQGMNHIFDGQFSDASKSFEELRLASFQAGFSGLPDFSFILLKRAEEESTKGNDEAAGFLIRRATELSPNDTRVLIAASSYIKILGMRTSTTYVGRAIHNFWKQPLVQATVLINILFVGLIALTLALILVAVIQVCRGSETIFNLVYYYLPNKYRGLIGPVAVLCLLAVPLALGVLGALAIWTLLICKTNSRARILGYFVGCLIFTWGVSIPILSAFGPAILSERTRIFQELQNGAYVPHAKELLQQSLSNSPQNRSAKSAVNQSLVKFSLARLHQLTGEYAIAESEWKNFLEVVPESSSLGRQALLNYAAVLQNVKRFNQADEIYDKLEKMGEKNFEFYYNRALSRIGQLDTAGHRHYFQLAESANKDTLTLLEAEVGEHPIALTVGVPQSTLYSLFFRVDENGENAHFRDKQRMLASSLVYGGRVDFLIFLGLAILLLVFLSRSKSGNTNTQGEISEEGIGVSPIWALVPGGNFANGKHPVAAILFISLFFGFIIASIEAPVKLYSSIPLDLGSSFLFTILAGLTLFFGLLFSSSGQLLFSGSGGKD